MTIFAEASLPWLSQYLQQNLFIIVIFQHNQDALDLPHRTLGALKIQSLSRWNILTCESPLPQGMLWCWGDSWFSKVPHGGSCSPACKTGRFDTCQRADPIHFGTWCIVSRFFVRFSDRTMVLVAHVEKLVIFAQLTVRLSTGSARWSVRACLFCGNTKSQRDHDDDEWWVFSYV